METTSLTARLLVGLSFFIGGLCCAASGNSGVPAELVSPVLQLCAADEAVPLLMPPKRRSSEEDAGHSEKRSRSDNAASHEDHWGRPTTSQGSQYSEPRKLNEKAFAAFAELFGHDFKWEEEYRNIRKWLQTGGVEVLMELLKKEAPVFSTLGREDAIQLLGFPAGGGPPLRGTVAYQRREFLIESYSKALASDLLHTSATEGAKSAAAKFAKTHGHQKLEKLVWACRAVCFPKQNLYFPFDPPTAPPMEKSIKEWTTPELIHAAQFKKNRGWAAAPVRLALVETVFNVCKSIPRWFELVVSFPATICETCWDVLGCYKRNLNPHAAAADHGVLCPGEPKIKTILIPEALQPTFTGYANRYREKLYARLRRVSEQNPSSQPRTSTVLQNMSTLRPPSLLGLPGPLPNLQTNTPGTLWTLYRPIATTAVPRQADPSAPFGPMSRLQHPITASPTSTGWIASPSTHLR